MRRLARLEYCGLMSIPMYWRPSSTATSPVVPAPSRGRWAAFLPLSMRKAPSQTAEGSGRSFMLPLDLCGRYPFQKPSRWIVFSPGQTRATGCRMATGRIPDERRKDGREGAAWPRRAPGGSLLPARSARATRAGGSLATACRVLSPRGSRLIPSLSILRTH